MKVWSGDPGGKILAEASSIEEEVIYAEIDPDKIEDVRRNWPFLRDRRVDTYGDLSQLYIDSDNRKKD